MFCRNVTLTLYERREENYQRVFSDDAAGTLKIVLNPISPKLFSERQKVVGTHCARSFLTQITLQ